MSAIVKTHTMFTDRECIIAALRRMGVNVTIPNGETSNIITDRVDYYGPERFVFENGRYVFIHDSTADLRGNRYPWNRNNLVNWNNVSDFLREMDGIYKKLYQSKLEKLAEEERKRELARQRQLVETKRDEIISNAKKQGYYVKQSEAEGKIKLILTRTTY